jgi:hypothetical protein
LAVRVRIRLERLEGRTGVETTGLANTGFESAEPEALLPVRVAERLGLWPAPRGAQSRPFESPAAAFSMITVPRSLRVRLLGSRRGIVCGTVIAERETEVVLNDHLIEALGLDLVAPASGLFRVGRGGRIRRSVPPEHW